MSPAVLATSTPGTTTPARRRRRGRQIKLLMRVCFVSLCFYIFSRKTSSKVSSRDAFEKRLSELGNRGDAREADDEDNLSHSAVPKRKSAHNPAPTRACFEESMRSNSSTGFFDAFFHKALADVDEFQGFNVSKATLASIANRSGGKIALYALQKHTIDDGKFGWNPVAGASEFYRRDFSRHQGTRQRIGKNLRKISRSIFSHQQLRRTQSMGVHCVDIDRLRKLHPNVGEGIVSPHRSSVERRLRRCHMDILFPFPDYFSHLRKKEVARHTHISMERAPQRRHCVLRLDDGIRRRDVKSTREGFVRLDR